MAQAIWRLRDAQFRIWRARRFKLFLNTLHPTPVDTVIDVGGTPAAWPEGLRYIRRVDLVNLRFPAGSHQVARGDRIRLVVGDGCAIPAASNAYKIGFSNSVIEHLGSWDRQQQFAAEIRRVADALWIQTPAYECPMEPHYMAPLIHWFPKSVQRAFAGWATPYGWLQRPSRNQVTQMIGELRLLKRGEMTQLFPDCEILTEPLIGPIPKSYIAVRMGHRAVSEQQDVRENL